MMECLSVVADLSKKYHKAEDLVGPICVNENVGRFRLAPFDRNNKICADSFRLYSS